MRAATKLLGMSLRKMVALAAVPVLASGCGVEAEEAPGAATAKQEVVYGTDDRMDVYAHPDARLQALAAQSTVALMSPSAMTVSSNGTVTFNARTLQSAYNLCSDQRFLADPTAAFCSGTLIDDDLVLTAGHCVTGKRDCTNTRFVFNYYRPASGALQTVTTADVYSCASIVARQQRTSKSGTLDFAVVRLDRPATAAGHVPAPVRAGNAPMAVGAKVAVIGSGSGVPFKVDSGGTVRDARAATLDYFEASTDTFGGNSGSGVYELGGHTVAGILVRGETDYVSNGTCNVVNVCAETGCSGEDITYVRPAINAYCAVASSARLCGN